MVETFGDAQKLVIGGIAGPWSRPTASFTSSQSSSPHWEESRRKLHSKDGECFEAQHAGWAFRLVAGGRSRAGSGLCRSLDLHSMRIWLAGSYGLQVYLPQLRSGQLDLRNPPRGYCPHTLALCE
jgi:hypothetical protein